MDKTVYRIEVPKVLSDVWFENFGPEFDFQTKIESSSISIAIDFTNTEWVELSSLISFASLIIKNLQKFSIIDFLFNFDSDAYSKNVLNANIFLINSSFFQAIVASLCQVEKEPIIRFNIRVNKHFSSKTNITEIVSSYLLKKTSSEDFRSKVNVNKISDGSSVLTITFGDKTEIFFDSDFFKMFNLKIGAIEDAFIIPMTYICNKKKSGQKCSNCNSVITRHVAFLSSKEWIINLLRTNLYLDSNDFSFSTELFEIISTWCSELLKNVRDHGGNFSLFAIRFGDWTTRKCYDATDPSNVIQKGICYNSKKIYFDQVKSKNTTKFIDIYFVDSGHGFISLSESCKGDNLIAEKKCENIRYLHRYAMLPHSTSKKIASSKMAPIHITGLGLVSEQAISRDSYISIKDRDIMTFFSKKKLGHVSNEGDNDQSSSYNSDSTMISCIIPFEDTEWKKHNIFKMEYIDSHHNNYIYINDFNSHNIKEIKVQRYNYEKKEAKKLNSFQNITKSNVDIVVLDLSLYISTFDKPIALKTINIIYHFIELNIPVVLFGANMPEMRIISSIIDGNFRIEHAPLEKKLKESKLFCPILSPAFELYMSGNLNTPEKNELLLAFKTGVAKKKAKGILQQWINCETFQLPTRRIDRVLNFFHGKSFHQDILKSHHIEEPVSDIHGNILDSYYELASYLRIPDVQRKWINDLIRIIMRYEINIIVLDSVESKALIQFALDYYYIKNISIHRYHDNKIEQLNISDNPPKALLLLSCTYSGSELRKVPILNRENGISINFVFTLLDLTQYSKKYIKDNWTRCDYDFFSKGKRPTPIRDTHIQPTYIANKKGRLVNKSFLDKQNIEVIQPLIGKELLYDFLSQINEVYIGHTIEHNHHYDVFIDVRNSIRKNNKLAQYFNILISKFITANSYIILYSEDSELYPIINLLIYPPGQRQQIDFIPVRQVNEDSFAWANLNQSYDLKNKNLIIIDEGAYSCNTLVGIIRLAVNYSPSKIDVVVLEKRPTVSSNIDRLQKLAEYHHKRGIDISYHSVIEIFSPVWSSHDCPFCELEIEHQKRTPKTYTKPIIFGGFELRDESAFILHITKCIYNGRTSCLEMIRQAEKKLKTSVVNTLLIKLFLIHSKQIEAIALTKEAENLVISIYKFLNDDSEKMELFNIHIKTCTKRGHKINVHFVKETLRSISSPNVFWNFVDLFKIHNDIYFEIGKIASKLNLTKEQSRLWFQIQNIVANNDVSRALIEFYKITGINRQRHHLNLSKQIRASDKITNGLSKLLEQLSNCIKRIGFAGVLREIHESMSDPQKVATLLNDKEIIESINAEYTMSAETVLKKIIQIYGAKTLLQVNSDKILRPRRNGHEMPLLCIHNDILVHLEDMLEDNQKHGKYIKLEYNIQRHCLFIRLVSDKKIDNLYMENARKGPKYNAVKEMLKTTGCLIGFEDYENQFATIIYLRVADYVKI